ncbi:JAB domain-containing protein, partial [Escherichia coli]|uniref:JAB domain-containing protein n=1 Tax=Escherichia coli TaxID=562 RepID=UPI002F96584D
WFSCSLSHLFCVVVRISPFIRWPNLVCHYKVIKRALYHNAAAVILAHNHPSGEVTPSKADRLITERLVQALGLVDIRVPDHLIVGGSQVFSFAEHGLL